MKNCFIATPTHLALLFAVFIHIQWSLSILGSVESVYFTIREHFSMQQHICRARYMLSPVRLSVRLSHGWISQKWLKLG